MLVSNSYHQHDDADSEINLVFAVCTIVVLVLTNTVVLLSTQGQERGTQCFERHCFVVPDLAE